MLPGSTRENQRSCSRRRRWRIWKAPFAVNGQALWVGAASHEGHWWDNSAGAVSYTADPNVDDERDFLDNSLQTTGLVERSGYVASVGEPGKTRPEASKGLRTDGRVFVMTLITCNGSVSGEPRINPALPDSPGHGPGSFWSRNKIIHRYTRQVTSKIFRDGPHPRLRAVAVSIPVSPSSSICRRESAAPVPCSSACSPLFGRDVNLSFNA